MTWWVSETIVTQLRKILLEISGIRYIYRVYYENVPAKYFKHYFLFIQALDKNILYLHLLEVHSIILLAS